MRDHPLLLEIGFAIGVAELPFGEVIGKAERHVATRAGEHVQQQPKALGTIGDVLEHDARSVFGPQHRLGCKPDVLLAIGALDRAHLAQPLGERKPFAQIVIRDIAGEIPLVDHCSSDLERCHSGAPPQSLSSGRPKAGPVGSVPGMTE